MCVFVCVCTECGWVAHAQLNSLKPCRFIWFSSIYASTIVAKMLQHSVSNGSLYREIHTLFNFIVCVVHSLQVPLGCSTLTSAQVPILQDIACPSQLQLSAFYLMQLLTVACQFQLQYTITFRCSTPTYLSSNRKCFYFGDRMQHTHLNSNRGTLILQLVGTAFPS